MLERLNVQFNTKPAHKLDRFDTKASNYFPLSNSSESMAPASYKEHSQTPKAGSRPLKGHFPDHKALEDQLPPNTGPAGTVDTNGGGILSSTSKNLSHVPCKFFKQGICQAGKSCPFSHDLDSSTGADKLPCKYFQKGNCKFGLKCALAHYLPDGTRVNNKSLLTYRRNNDRSERNKAHQATMPSPSSSTSNQVHDGSSYYYKPTQNSYSSSDLADFMDNTPDSAGTNAYPMHGDSTTTSFSMPITPLTQSRYNLFVSTNTTSQLQDAFGSGDWLGHPSFNFSSNLFSASNSNIALAGSAFYTGMNTSPSNSYQIPLVGNSRGFQDARNPSSAVSLPSFSLNYQRKNSSSSSSPTYVYNQFVPEEAVVNDEAEGKGEEEPFFEDYVPASLGNLILTPQEQQRRTSRSQSGTLLVRPTITKPTSNDLNSEKCWAQQLAPKPDDSVFLME